MRKKTEFICSRYVLEKDLCNKPSCFIKTRNVAKVLPDSSKVQRTTKRIRCLLYDVFVGDSCRALHFSVSNIYIYIYIYIYTILDIVYIYSRVTIFMGFVHRLVFKLAMKYAQNIKILTYSLLFSLGIKNVNAFYKKYFDTDYKIFRVLVTD